MTPPPTHTHHALHFVTRGRTEGAESARGGTNHIEVLWHARPVNLGKGERAQENLQVILTGTRGTLLTA